MEKKMETTIMGYIGTDYYKGFYRAGHVGIGPCVFVRRSMAFGGRGEGGRAGGGVIMPTCSFDSTLSHASPGSLYGLLCKCSGQNF